MSDSPHGLTAFGLKNRVVLRGTFLHLSFLAAASPCGESTEWQPKFLEKKQ